jgi:aspartate racemase
MSSLVAKGIEIQEIPGYHHTLFKEPYVQVLAEKLTIAMDNALANYSQNLYSQKAELEKSITRENLLSFTSLVPIQPSGNKTPLFGIHVLGKGCKTYRSLANHLGVEQPIYGLNYGLAVQNSDGKLSPLLKVEELAAHYIQEMQTLQPEGPYFLAGYSFGGLIAFEMAQQLYKQGQKVALLVLFDTFHKTSVKRISWNKRAYDHLDNVLKNGFDYLLQKIIGKIKWTSNQLNRKRQSREIKLYIVSRITVSAEEANTLEQHANKIASSNYVPQTYPGKVTLFKAKITSDRIAHEGWYVDPSLGWEELVGSGLEVYEISADHHSMFREPHVQVLVDKLRVCIDKALDDDREGYNPEPRKSTMEVEDAASF